MPEYNKPLSLLRTRSYPGYQFFAVMKYEEQPPEKCMRYLILIVAQWLRSRIGSSQLPEGLLLPDPENFSSVTDADFVSFHISQGYALDVTAMTSAGLWAARLKEPDVDRPNAHAVIGRFFVTQIGIHLIEDAVELGIRIDVLDPMDVEEVAHAYRPAFLRWLFNNQQLHIHQIDPLRLNQPTQISNTPMLKRFERLIESHENMMPSIVFTHACQRKSVKEMMEKLDACLGLSDQADSFTAQLRRMDLVPETLEFADSVLPYDADYVSAHAFGYGRIYVVSERMFNSFQRRVCPSIRPGDVLWIEPSRFGGRTRLYSYDANRSGTEREQIREQLLHEAHVYSKHKSYSFGGILFEAAARRLETEERLRVRLQQLQQADQAKIEQQTAELYRQTEQLLALYEEEKQEKQAELDHLLQEYQQLNARLAVAEARQGRPAAQEGLCLHTPEVSEYYPDEQYDLVVSILTEARRFFCMENSRAAELLEGLLKENRLTGDGLKTFEQLKTILFRNKNITESDISDLKALGFEVSRHSNNHYKLVFRGDHRYTFTLPSTGSDVRGMKNSYSEIMQKLSVYK